MNADNQIKIGIYSREIDHFIETVATFLAWDGRFQVTLVISGEPFSDREHYWSLRRLVEAARVRIITWDEEPQQWDVLYLNGNDLPCGERKRARLWASRAGEIGWLSQELYGASRMQFLKAGIRRLRCTAWARRAMVRAAAAFHPCFLICRTKFYSAYVHPQFFNRPDLLPSLREAGQRRRETRRYTFAFIGNREPEARGEILRSLRREFTETGCEVQDSTSAPPRPASVLVLWIEYGGEKDVRGLKPDEFLTTLEDVEFCLCPFGWGKWSHRVVEALVAGAIPILEGESSYNRGLRDGVNCLVVHDGDWIEAVRRARAMPLGQRRAIRGNIYQLREAQLSPEVAARDCVIKLGWERAS
jgi:hypothetical protein